MTKQSELGLGDSPETAILREVKRLQTDRRYRQQRGEFFVEGVRNFVLLADCQFTPKTILFSEKLLIAPLARKFVRRWRRAGVPTINLSPEKFRLISQTERASGVGAIVPQRWKSLDTVTIEKGLCWILLAKVRSDGNFGTLMRTATAVGAEGFIILDSELEPYAPDTVRASMGAVFNQTFVRTNLGNLRAWLKKNQVEIIGASPDGETDFHEFSFAQTRLLFIGEERQGLSPEQRGLCQRLVRIPMEKGVDSLNLGVAGSLILYEIFRAKRKLSYWDDCLRGSPVRGRGD